MIRQEWNPDRETIWFTVSPGIPEEAHTSPRITLSYTIAEGLRCLLTDVSVGWSPLLYGRMRDLPAIWPRIRVSLVPGLRRGHGLRGSPCPNSVKDRRRGSKISVWLAYRLRAQTIDALRTIVPPLDKLLLSLERRGTDYPSLRLRHAITFRIYANGSFDSGKQRV